MPPKKGAKKGKKGDDDDAYWYVNRQSVLRQSRIANSTGKPKQRHLKLPVLLSRMTMPLMCLHLHRRAKRPKAATACMTSWMRGISERTTEEVVCW